MRRRARSWLTVGVCALILCPMPARADSTANRVSLDLFAFSQGDSRRDPYKNEAFRYLASSIAFRVAANDRVAFRGDTSVGYIMPSAQPALPPTITNATVTSASPRIVTWDITFGLEIRSGRWVWQPALYFHQQFGWVVPGANLALRGEFFGGDGLLDLDYSFRFAVRGGKYWDDSYRGWYNLSSHTLLVGWTQTLSPHWITNASLQYVRQDGLTKGYYNFLVFADGNGVPTRLGDEELPGRRNRGQLSLRARYSPLLGLSVGLDLSGYIDDWRIRHGSAQLSLEVPAESWLRMRFWYRFAAQQGSRYYTATPVTGRRYQTTDSDLGSFTMHSAGALMRIHVAGTTRPHWMVRASLLGFHRSDGLSAIGGNLGVEATW